MPARNNLYVCSADGLCSVCALINVSLLIAAGAYYFFLEKKVAKIQDIGNASLAAQGLCPHQANPLPLSCAQASIVLPDLARSKPLSGRRKVKQIRAGLCPARICQNLRCFVTTPTAKRLPGENEQNNGGLCAEKGISLVPEAAGTSVRSGGIKVQPCGSVCFAGQWPCAAREAFLLS
ncbi:hypothetical protein HQ865_07935 [Mucilaginibacter mali]|uniref:Uncharacterized protein n=1 Tax=Mucilaginibacter mali TaxID=2740462 RepID=A0A7D4Q2I9_9SPHI|nr:hypothetical protein [Mucilaginibacter mali]QKJ29687.1 hypothetical protein HQ865_07935 [Mucilaginibacter mali]